MIEGFYGPPWTWTERCDMASRILEWGGNWYVWAPKSEPRHRDRWSEPFERDEVAGFSSIKSTGINVGIGITPGPMATVGDVIDKLGPVDASMDAIVVCFDDLDEHDAGRRHARLAGGVAQACARPVWMVPTHYAGTTRSAYLDGLMSDLDPSIEVMWTGDMVVCDTITTVEAAARTRVCGGRLPLLWDNTPVNDAMMRDLLHLGPYQGREESLRDHLSGLLVNPMEFALASRPTIRSAMAWAQGRDHLAEWHDEVDRLGLAVLAQATAFPGDVQWPGEDPDRAWWQSVRDLADPSDPRLMPWVTAAREGAQAALALLDAREHADGPRAAQSTVGAALTWRAWRGAAGPCVLGRGPRVRPLFSQDESARFVPRPGVATDSTSLVDGVARRVFGS